MSEVDQVKILTGEIVESRTPEQWAALVRSDLGQAVAGFIAASKHLVQAKQQIPHGDWLPWVKRELPISISTVDKLIALSRNPALTNSEHVTNFPPSWGTLYELSRLDPPLLEAAIEAGRVHPELERKEAKALVVEYKSKAAEVTFDPRHGDFADKLGDIEPGTVDAIITDPPYPAEFLPLYGKLSEYAARLLKPGGVCAVMSGQTHLPDVMAELGKHLRWHWPISYATPGGQAVQIFPRKVNTFWKPILVYCNGNYTGEWFGDVAKSDVNDNDKRFHHWGQSESGMADLIKRLSRPGDLICDPFMGAGTTGVAALAMGRSFIGCDVNADHVEAARERLEQTVLERLGVDS